MHWNKQVPKMPQKRKWLTQGQDQLAETAGKA